MWASAAIAAFLFPTSFGAWYSEVQFSGLEALYNSTNGPEWAISTGWRDTSIGICNWYGVTCDREGSNVTGLSLRNNNLVGDISEATELTSVTSLEEVDLSNNQISGPVPLVLGILPNLETLDLSGNELTYFPAGWGSTALGLRYLSLQNNRIFGTLPADWLDINDSGSVSSTHPPVHLHYTSSWLPELRSLLLGGNRINATGYTTLETVANWRSLQTLDLSDNALSGSVEDALSLYYYCDGSGTSGCGGNMSSVAAPLLRVLKLDGNYLKGLLPQAMDTSSRKIDVFDVADNRDIVGEVPSSYSELLMLFAESTGLSGQDLPPFVDPVATTAAGALSQQSTAHNLSVCPALEPFADENIITVLLDPAYDGYSLCTCGDGFQGSGDSCSECSLGTYRIVDEDDSLVEGVCLPCPSDSTTLQTGRWLKSQCVCSAGFYDAKGGAGSEPSCLACPSGSTTPTAGATTNTSCECEPGRILNTTSGACEGCAAGTYKPAYGNQIGLCLPCPAGHFSEEIGATSQSFCEACPLGSYGESPGLSSEAGCVECSAGTYGSVQGLSSEIMCTDCWPGYYSESLGAISHLTCIECPANHSQPVSGATSMSSCIPCEDDQVANQGSSACQQEFSEDGTLIGLYLLIVGIILVVFTLLGVFLQKHCRVAIPVAKKVHMKLNEEMKSFIFGQQFWISLFSGVEIMDLMSDLGAYASLLYTAALTGAIKVVYTIVVAFALVASLHGVHTRAMIILDMQEERMHGLAITGNNMLYYEKQFTILQIMTQKRTCRIHVPFDRGNKYLSHHIGVQRLISLNSMRIFIAVFEDVPFLGLNMFLLMTQPDLASNFVFMMSFVMSIFVLGYKMTLLEKHARLQIRKWNLEARMDTDTMLNKKAARGRRFSWACQQCEDEETFLAGKKETREKSVRKVSERVGIPNFGESTTAGPVGDGRSSSIRKRATAHGDSSENGRASTSDQVINGDNDDRTSYSPATARHTDAESSPTVGGLGGRQYQHAGEGAEDGTATGAPGRKGSSSGRNNADRIIKWNMFRGKKSTRKTGDTKRKQVRKNKQILPFESGFDDDAGREGEALTDPLMLDGQQLSTHIPSPGGEFAGREGTTLAPPGSERHRQGFDG